MIRNILVPLDGSPSAEAALPYATDLAARSGARLTLVQAAHPHGLFTSDINQHRAIADAEEYVAARAAELAASGLHVETGVPYGGNPAMWIVEEIQLRNADMVVMATHARSGPDRWVHGSVAEAVVSQTSVPVLLVRASASVTRDAGFGGSQPKLIVPLDGSELAEAAVPVAADLAASLDGQIVLMTVLPPLYEIARTQGAMLSYDTLQLRQQRMHSNAQAYLDQITPRLRSAGATVETLLRVGEPPQEIAAASTEDGVACVVMATHGRTGLTRSIVGSVAGETLRLSSHPVVLVRPSSLAGSRVPVRVQPLATAVNA